MKQQIKTKFTKSNARMHQTKSSGAGPHDDKKQKKLAKIQNKEVKEQY